MKRFFIYFASGVLLASCSSGGGQETFVDEIINASLVPANKDYKYGFVNADGQLVIPADFRNVAFFHDGLACAIDSAGDYSGYIDTKGQFKIKCEYSSVSDFSDGLAWVAMPDSALTAIDKKGNVKLRCPLAYTIQPFMNGYAIFNTFDGRIGLIDKKGTTVMLPDSITDIHYPSDGYLYARTDRSRSIIYAFKDGAFILAPVSERFDITGYDNKNRLAVIKQGDKYGIADYDGNLKVNPRYDRLSRDGKLYIFRNDKEKYGWIDADGKEVIAAKYKSVEPFGSDAFKSDYAVVSTSGNKDQVINSEGKTVISPKYDRIKSFDGKYFLVKNSSGWGIVDASNGETVCDPQFEQIEPVSTKVLMATSGEGKWGVIDIHGKYLGAIDYSSPTQGMHISSQASTHQFNVDAVAEYLDRQVKTLEGKTDLTLGQLMSDYNISERSLEQAPFATLFTRSAYNDMFSTNCNANLSRNAKTVSYSGYWSRRANTTVNRDAKVTSFSIFVSIQDPAKNREVAETLEKKYGIRIAYDEYNREAFNYGDHFIIEINPGQPASVTPPIVDMWDDEDGSAGLDNYLPADSLATDSVAR